jgi:citrate synthase
VTEKGLRDVVAADTKVSDIDGAQGKLWYVGYPIEDLAEHSSFEEVVYLLHHGELPTSSQLDDLTRFMSNERKLSPFGT